MSRLLAIGEALIDFIPKQSGVGIKDVEQFSPKAGGAPANVCGVFSKLGDESQMITQLGNDPFANKILEEFKKYNIGCDYISRTEKGNTSLAFVALKEDGNREFSFYRNPGADMLLEADAIRPDWFEGADVLHFCSVSLGDFPMKEAHRRAISYAEQKGLLISFDPNLRFPLWKSREALKKTVWEFIPYADVLKISDEELEFLTGTTQIREALSSLFTGNVEVIVYTKGAEGAEAYTKNVSAQAGMPELPGKVVDTTGAGDAFIGSFLWQLARDKTGKDGLPKLGRETLTAYLKASNAYCGASVCKHGAIESYPERI